ncbi:MAG: hypothetical protein COC06_02275 [Bacteroidales bacterium]|nr:MAG: hypothetical protein COC06_02275 [Bacteroidales bacterium]
MKQVSDNIPVKTFRDFDNKPHEFNIRSIKDIRERCSVQLSIPKRFDFYKIVYVTHGNGWHKVDLHNIQLSPQTILPIDSNRVQYFIDATELDGFVIHFSRDFFIKERENYKYLFNFNIFSEPSVINCTPELAIILNQLKTTYDSISLGEHYEQIINYLRVLLLELEIKRQPQHSNCLESSEQHYCKFKKALEKNITYQTRVKDICQHIKVDAKRLNSALKNTFGKNAKELLDERLVLEIKRLLAFSNLSAKEIAFKLKFDEAANMSNYFKRHTQYTPLQFRNKKEQPLYL